MSDTQSFVEGLIDSPLIGNDKDKPPRLTNITRSCGRALEAAPTEPNDGAWAVAFKILAAIAVFSAVYFRRMALVALGKELESVLSMSESHSVVGTILALILAIPTSYALLSFLLQTMATCPALVHKFVFASVVLVSVAALIAAASVGLMAFTAVLAVLCTDIAWGFCLRRGRINFAAATLKIAALSIKSTPQVVVWTLCATAFRVCFHTVFVMASLGPVHAFQEVVASDGVTYLAAHCHTVAQSMSTTLSCECNGDAIADVEAVGCQYGSYNKFLVCFWLASVVWAYMAAVNIVTATVAGSVATWWVSPDDVKSVWVSFHRVMHSSQGSACKVAGISGFLELLIVAVQQFLDPGWMISWLLTCPRHAVNYMLNIMVCFISMYRLSFSQAAHRAWTLLRKHGLTLFINEIEVFMGWVLTSLPALAMAVVTFLVVALPAMDNLSPSLSTILVFFGSLAVTMLAMLEVILCASKAVFIFFLQDPETFAASHDRRLFDGMYKAWREMGLQHPTLADE